MRMGFWAVLSFIVLAAAGCSSGSTRDTAESRLKDWVNLQAAKVGENPDAAPVTFCERDRDCAMNERCEIIEGICQPHACPIVFRCLDLENIALCSESNRRFETLDCRALCRDHFGSRFEAQGCDDTDLVNPCGCYHPTQENTHIAGITEEDGDQP